MKKNILLKNINNSCKFIYFCLLVMMVFISGQKVVFADTYGVVLSVNGGEDASVLNGEVVTLSWFLNAPSGSSITNCSIKLNGVVIHDAIDSSVLPATGSIDVTPPSNTDSNYSLNCDQNTSGVSVNTNLPTASITITEGTNPATAVEVDSLQFGVTFDRVKGVTSEMGTVNVNWTSANTHRCSVLQKEFSDNPGVLFSETSVTNEYTNFQGVSGSVRYDGSPRVIKQTTTFYITCYNDYTGESVTASKTLVVMHPQTPQPITINLYTLYNGSTTVKQNLISGFATTSIGFWSSNAYHCTPSVRYQNGTPYPNPRGWGTPSDWWLGYNNPNIKIATTTEFSVTCYRNAVTFQGITYEATSTTKTLLITVKRPDGVGSGIWDRSSLEQVEVEVIPVENPIYKNPVSGRASASFRVDRWGSPDYCDIKTYNINNTPADNSDDIEIFVLGTSYTTLYGNGSTQIYGAFSSTTRISAYCYREYDVLYGTEEDKKNGTDQKDLLMEVLEPIVALPAPTVNLFAGYQNFSIFEMDSYSSEMIGFEHIDYDAYPLRMKAATGSTINSIKIPLDFGASIVSGLFNISLGYCDESDGVATYRVKINNVLVSEFVSDDPSSPVTECQGVASDDGYINKLVATNYPVYSGDDIVVECERAANSNESCDINDLTLYTSSVVTPQVNPLVTFTPANLLWNGSNIGFCDTYTAKPINQSEYVWYDTDINPAGYKNLQISTSTIFSIKCGRYSDNQKAEAIARFNVPFKSDLSSEVAVNVGECRNDGTFPAYALEEMISPAPKGYSPDAAGYCKKQLDLVPTLVHLAYNAPSVVVDHDNGLYKGVPVRFIIDSINIGGYLPVGEAVPYDFTINFDSGLGLSQATSSGYVYSDGIDLVTDLKKSTGLLSAQLDSIDIPFGSHEICMNLNIGGASVYPEVDISNNTSCLDVDIPPPTPHMEIKANNVTDSLLIRQGQTVNISWEAKANYQLNCMVVGSGIPGNIVFNPADDYPNAHAGSANINLIKNKIEYLLQCNEPVTEKVFRKSAWIEVVPTYTDN